MTARQKTTRKTAAQKKKPTMRKSATEHPRGRATRTNAPRILSKNGKVYAGVLSKKKPPKGDRVFRDGKGRPTKLNPEYYSALTRLCLLGETNAGLGIAFDVSAKTIENWMKQDAGFLRAVRRGRDEADAHVANSLYHRARGAKHPDVHVSNFQGDITITHLVKHYPPDTNAASMWLRNRRPDKWRTDALLTQIDPEENQLPTPVKVVIEFKDARKAPDNKTLTDEPENVDNNKD